MENIKDLLTAMDVANILGVSRQSVIKWANKKKLPSYRLSTSNRIYFKREDIDEIIRRVEKGEL